MLELPTHDGGATDYAVDDRLVEYEREVRSILPGQQVCTCGSELNHRGQSLSRRFLIIENLQNGSCVFFRLENSRDKHWLKLTYSGCRGFVVDQFQKFFRSDAPVL